MSHLENNKTFLPVINGVSPSRVFNEILASSSDIDKYAVADLFMDEFPKLDSKVLNVIWSWKSAKSSRGISDEEFDSLIREFLATAGYLP